jgi:hypothetical protein
MDLLLLVLLLYLLLLLIVMLLLMSDVLGTHATPLHYSVLKNEVAHISTIQAETMPWLVDSVSDSGQFGSFFSLAPESDIIRMITNGPFQFACSLRLCHFFLVGSSPSCCMVAAFFGWPYQNISGRNHEQFRDVSEKHPSS